MSKDNRRQYASGAIYQRKDGRWIGVIEAGWTPKGTRRRVTVSATTEAACKRRLGAKQEEIARNGVAGVSSRVTVKAYADEWIDRIEHEVKPKTYAGYRSAMKKWVVPTIGRKQLRTLNPGDIRAVSTAIRDAGKSTSTARHTQIALEKMLKDARLDGHVIPPNALLVKLPTKGTSDRTAIEYEHALSLLEAASKLPDGSRWATAMLQGLRQAECLGLTWAEVDLEEATLAVSWQLQALPYRKSHDRASGFRVPDGYESRQLDGALHLVRPKSKAGWRVVPLVPWMVDALRTWQKIAPANDHGLVWPADDGRPRIPAEDTAAWKALQDAAGVRHESGRYYHGHEARHATATLLLEAGVDTEVIKTILGHSSIVTSQGYMHVNRRQARDAIARVADRLKLQTGEDRREIEGSSQVRRH